MNWKPELDEMTRREAFALQMGGADKVKRQHDFGRLTVRERIGKLVDDGTFHETGAMSGVGEYEANGDLKTVMPANCVFGRAKIDGRPVVVVGDDFTVRGGSADASIKAKPLMAEQMANSFRLPIIRIIEGSGGGGSVKTIETRGAANLPGGVDGTQGFYFMTENLAHVPVVGLGLGSVAGLGAARLASTHYSVMTKSSAMFVAGPPLVARLGQPLSKTELGGWEIQTKCGAIDHAVDTEEEAFECAGRFLSYLPSSIHELPPTVPCNDDPERADEALMNIVPRNKRQVYKMRTIIELVVDKGSFFEMGQNFGRSIIAGFNLVVQQGLLRDIRLLSGPGFVGVDGVSSATDAEIQAFVQSFFAEQLHESELHPDAWPGVIIRQPEDAEARLAARRRRQIHIQAAGRFHRSDRQDAAGCA